MAHLTKVTRENPFTGQLRSIELPIVQGELDRIEAGELVQEVAPHLTANQREFIISGITGEEFDALFEEDEK